MAEREGFEPPIRLPVCRISSAVLSTTQPPLRGRRRRKHPVGRRLCIQRETVKHDRSVVRGGSSWRSIAGTRRKTLATKLGLSRGLVLAEPADDQVGDRRVVLVHHAHVTVA